MSRTNRAIVLALAVLGLGALGAGVSAADNEGVGVNVSAGVVDIEIVHAFGGTNGVMDFGPLTLGTSTSSSAPAVQQTQTINNVGSEDVDLAVQYDGIGGGYGADCNATPGDGPEWVAEDAASVGNNEIKIQAATSQVSATINDLGAATSIFTNLTALTGTTPLDYTITTAATVTNNGPCTVSTTIVATATP